MLLSQNEIISILKKAIPRLTEEECRAAAGALVAATGKWKEANLKEMFGASLSVQCKDICALGEAHSRGFKIKAFIEES